MTKYKAFFSLPRGVTFSMDFEHEGKHYTVADFDAEMRLLARRLGAEYLYCEEVES